MTAVTIATRELRERSRLFLICAALAVMPFVAGMLPGARADRAGVVTTASSYIALTMALGSALALGVSTIVRDLVERRLSFYFSKPVPAASIWFGKAAAALLSSLACFAIVALPSALLVEGWPGPGMWMLSAPQLIGLTVLGVVVLFFGGHFLASITRSRSVLLGVDFVLAAIAGVSLALIARPLVAGGAMELTGALTSAFAVALLLVLIVAPVYQLARGRTDIRRGHAALSRFFWPVLFAVIGAIGAYVLWVVSAKPHDVVSMQYLEQSPRGEEVVTGGTMRGRGDFRAVFLMEGSGSWRRLPLAPWTGVSFSRDGNEMVWTEAAGLRSNEVELHTKRGGPSGIRVPRYVDTTLSDDGSRVAVGRGSLVSVYATAGGRLLASAAGFNPGMRHAMFFVTNDVLRIIEVSYSAREVPMRVFELDIVRKKLTKTGELMVGSSSPFGASHDGSRLLLRRTRRVVDGRTLATIAQLPARDATSTVLLDDGRVAETVREGGRSRLRIYDGPEVVLPIAYASIVGQLPDGKLIVRGTRRQGWSATGAERTMFVVDPVQGAIVRTVPQVRGPELKWEDPRLPRYDTQRLAGVDKEGKLVWWDVKTGRVEPAP